MHSFYCCTGGKNDLDHTSKIAIILSAMVIFTTIQAQDFQDVTGDQASTVACKKNARDQFRRVLEVVTLIFEEQMYSDTQKMQIGTINV
jgi:hypothetical protein